MTDQQTRKAWRLNIFASVSELGDIHYQRLTWLDPEMQNPHFSYVEFCECFYDICAGDYYCADKNNDKAPFRQPLQDGVISEEERDAVWLVHLALLNEEAPDQYDHAAILESPGWLSVVDQAKLACEKLRVILVDPEELLAFENPLPTSAMKKWP